MQRLTSAIVRRAAMPMASRWSVAAAAAAPAASIFTSASRFASSTVVSSTSFASRSVNPIKYDTGITGVPAVPNAREVLIGLYEETIRQINVYGDNDYNRAIKQLCQYRLSVAQANESHEAIENEIMTGQIEELIEQAEDELDLLVVMNEEIKPWLPDPEGDAEFATYHSSFGQEPKDSDLTMPDESIWAEVDAKFGLKPAASQ